MFRIGHSSSEVLSKIIGLIIYKITIIIINVIYNNYNYNKPQLQQQGQQLRPQPTRRTSNPGFKLVPN